MVTARLAARTTEVEAGNAGGRWRGREERGREKGLQTSCNSGIYVGFDVALFVWKKRSRTAVGGSELDKECSTMGNCRQNEVRSYQVMDNWGWENYVGRSGSN